jgi:hypothetical protein
MPATQSVDWRLATQAFKSLKGIGYSMSFVM